MTPITYTDYYKTQHYRMYAPGCSLIFSNGTFRKSRIPGVNKVVWFGLQVFCKKYLIEKFNKNFFERPLEEVIEEYSYAIGTTTEHISALHERGSLPIKIMALPEGSLVSIRVAPFVIWNTDPDFYWLTNYLETLISCQIWQPCTSATLANELYEMLSTYAIETTGSDDFVKWQGHDFSMRGMSSLESAILSGLGHLSSFSGTDTIPAIYAARNFYNAKEPVGASVPATEHSIMCLGTKDEEIETFARLLDLYPKGILSIVSDTWNLWKVCTDFLVKLKDKIMAREGKLVIRPDSGDPVDIICGKVSDELNSIKEIGHFLSKIFFENITGKHYFSFENNIYSVTFNTLREFALEYGIEQMFDFGKHTKLEDIVSGGRYSYIRKEDLPTPEAKGVVELLWDIFGGKINDKGYKELDPHIGAIYGDAINYETAKQICERLKAKGFASTNIVFGVGSYTYQYNTRDTFGFAIKATYGELREEISRGFIGKEKIVSREIFKDPITDDGTKKSAKGLIAVFKDEEGEYIMKDEASWKDVMNCEYEPVFEDGVLLRDQNFEDIRKRIREQSKEKKEKALAEVEQLDITNSN